MKRALVKGDLAPFFGKLPDRTNKGDMGRVLVVCGSYDPCGTSMCGAAYFSASAAYKTGAGIVEIFTPRENYAPLASLMPEAVFSLYGYDESLDAVTSRLALSVRKSDAVVIGCGLGKSETSRAIVKAVFASVSCPLLIDADGLNILSDDEGLWEILSEEQRSRTVITPHIGEMSRLSGRAVAEILSDTEGVATAFAEQKGIVCLLKDHNTVITDGEALYINQSGNAGMATAGMGDVLAGVVGALLARTEISGDIGEKSEILLRVAAGAYLHGRAGDLAEGKTLQYSLTASDLLAEIPSAIRDIFV